MPINDNQAQATFKWAVVGDSLSDDGQRPEADHAHPHYYSVIAKQPNSRYVLSNWKNNTTKYPNDESACVYAVGSTGYSRTRASYNPTAGDTPETAADYLNPNDNFSVRMLDIESDCDITTVIGSINDRLVRTSAPYPQVGNTPLGILPDSETGENSMSWLSQDGNGIVVQMRSGEYYRFRETHYARMAQCYFNWKKTVVKPDAKLIICSHPWAMIDAHKYMSMGGQIANLRAYQYNFAKKYGLHFYDFLNDYGYICREHTTADGTANTDPSNAFIDGMGNPVLDDTGRAVDWYGRPVWNGQMFFCAEKLSSESTEDWEKVVKRREWFCRLFIHDYNTAADSLHKPGAHWNTMYNRVALAPMFKDILDYETGLTSTPPPMLITGDLPAIQTRRPYEYADDPPTQTYKATFVADGRVIYTVEFEAGASVLPRVPAVPAKVGYTGAWEPYTLADADITINAVYTANTYRITFTADGVTVAVVPYQYGAQSITEPAVPPKEGYTGVWSAYTLGAQDSVSTAVYTPIEWVSTNEYVNKSGESIMSAVTSSGNTVYELVDANSTVHQLRRQSP